MPFLQDFGWSPHFESLFVSHARSGLAPARVLRVDRGAYLLAAREVECVGEPSGRLRHGTARLDLPTTGDFVAARWPEGEGPALVEAVLPRRSCVVRKASGERAEPQVLAANVDLGLVLMALGPDFNARRLERYVGLLLESEVTPVLVLTKADAATEREVGDGLAEAQALAPGARVLAISVRAGLGLRDLEALLVPGATTVLLGSSGVGKSTLLNHLLGGDVQAVSEVREYDGKGRHTTTRRELFRLPGGALVIDTPGLRELQAWDGPGTSGAFPDIEALAARCRFHDCSHASEDGCAVAEAIADGRLEQGRFRGFEKLRREEAYLARQKDEALARTEKQRWKKLTAESWEASRRKRRT